MPSATPRPAGRRRERWLLGALVFVVLASGFSFSVGLPASRNATITGDEPFYLITTQSLLDDGDLDLWNQYEYETYRSFFDHPDRLWRQAAPLADGRVLSPHDPGLAVLLLPGYAIGGRTGAQVELLLIAALALTLAYVLAANISGRPRLAAGVTVATALFAPGFVYATEIYPEMPAALLLVAGLLVLRSRPSLLRAVVLAVLCSGLAWLGMKYVVPGGVLAAIYLWENRRREGAVFLGLSAVSAAVYTWWHLDVFGALTPYNGNLVYNGESTPSVIGSHLGFTDRIYRIWGLFVDRRFGIGRWAPALLPVLPLLPFVARAAPRARPAVALILAQVGIATFVSVTMMGWWFPGRMLIVVYPLFAVVLTIALAHAPAFWRAAWFAAAAYSLGMTAFLVRAATAGDVTLAVDPFAMPDLPFRVIGWAFPDYRQWTTGTTILNALWLAALIASSVWAILPGNARRALAPTRPMLRRVPRQPGPPRDAQALSDP